MRSFGPFGYLGGGFKAGGMRLFGCQCQGWGCDDLRWRFLRMGRESIWVAVLRPGARLFGLQFEGWE